MSNFVLACPKTCKPIAAEISTEPEFAPLPQRGELDPLRMRQSVLGGLGTATHPPVAAAALAAHATLPTTEPRREDADASTSRLRNLLTEAEPAWQAAIRPIDPKLPRVDWEAEPIAAAELQVALAAARLPDRSRSVAGHDGAVALIHFIERLGVLRAVAGARHRAVTPVALRRNSPALCACGLRQICATERACASHVGGSRCKPQGVTMHKSIYALLAATALIGAAPTAQASPAGSLASPRSDRQHRHESEQAAVYVYGGHRYCFYFDGCRTRLVLVRLPPSPRRRLRWRIRFPRLA